MWINVNDKLPTPGERIICSTKSFVGEGYISDTGRWHRMAGYDIIGVVTHWQSMPKSASEDSKIVELINQFKSEILSHYPDLHIEYEFDLQDDLYAITYDNRELNYDDEFSSIAGTALQNIFDDNNIFNVYFCCRDLWFNKENE